MRTQESPLGHLVHPDHGRRPGLVMVPDVWGLSDHYRDLAGRVAAEGFAVLAIDPYRKTGHPQKMESPADALAWIRELPDPLVLETLREAREHLAEAPAAAGQAIGITGFCMGGQYAILGGCLVPGFAACAPFYGMLVYEDGLDPAKKPRQPLDAIADLACPFLGLYGAEDHLIPVEQVRELEQRLAKTGQPAEVVLYEGAGHAFMNETRPQMHRPDAARDAFARLVAFLEHSLEERPQYER